MSNINIREYFGEYFDKCTVSDKYVFNSSLFDKDREIEIPDVAPISKEIRDDIRRKGGFGNFSMY